MRRIFSLVLALCMVVSAIGFCCADDTSVMYDDVNDSNTDDTLVTLIKYYAPTEEDELAEEKSNKIMNLSEYWKISVPATIECGEEKTVMIGARFSSDKVLNVSVPEYTMLSSEGQDDIQVGIKFGGVSLQGNDDEEIYDHSNIYVEIPGVEEGEWSGRIEYTVSLDDAPEIQ